MVGWGAGRSDAAAAAAALPNYSFLCKGVEGYGSFPYILGRAGVARTEPYHQIEIKLNVTMWDAANKSISLTNWF